MAPVDHVRRARWDRSPGELPPDCRLYKLPADPPRFAVLTLGMPRRICSADTTSGPNWKLAPPPVMLKLNVLLATEAELSVKLRFRSELLSDAIQAAAGRFLAVDRGWVSVRGAGGAGVREPLIV